MNEELKDKMKKYKCDFSSISATLEIQRGDNQTVKKSVEKSHFSLSTKLMGSKDTSQH